MSQVNAILSFPDVHREMSRVALNLELEKRWRFVDPSLYYKTPTGTGSFRVYNTTPWTQGLPVKWAQQGTFKYGMLTGISSDVISIAGVPLVTSAVIDGMWLGAPELVSTIVMTVHGNYEAAAAAGVWWSIQKEAQSWHRPPARIVRVRCTAATADATVQPTVNALLSSNRVLSSHLTPPAGSWVDSGATVNPTYARVGLDNYFDVEVVTAAGTKDGTDLTMQVYLVQE